MDFFLRDGTCKEYFWIVDFNIFLVFFLKHNQWQHTHGWIGVSNNCWKYLSQRGEGLSNIVKIFSCIIFEVNVLWTLIVKDGCSMCNGSIGLLHVNTSSCGFSCECSRNVFMECQY
jgi:hypothetical protein